MVAAIAFSLAFLLLRLAFPAPFATLESRLYDRLIAISASAPDPRIVILSVDPASVAALGPWPWDAEQHTRIFQRLRASGARVVASTWLPPASAADPTRAALDDLDRFLAQSPLTQRFPAELSDFDAALRASTGPDRPIIAGLNSRWQATLVSREYGAAVAQLQDRIAALRGAAGGDALVQAIQQGPRSFLPVLLREDSASVRAPGAGLQALDSGLDTAALLRAPDYAALRLLEPGPSLVGAASGLGLWVHSADADGITRRLPLVLRFGQTLYPSLALRVAAEALGMSADALEVSPGPQLELNHRVVPLSDALDLRPQFHRGTRAGSAFPIYPVSALLDGHLGPEALRDRIVLMGGTTADFAPLDTPLDRGVPAVQLLADTVASLLSGQFYDQPSGANAIALGMVVLGILFLSLALPAMRLIAAVAFGLALVAGLLLIQTALLRLAYLWVPLGLPAALIALGLIFMSLWRVLSQARTAVAAPVAGRAAAKGAEAEFEGALKQAQRGAGGDRQLLDRLYQLGLDFERRQQFDKALEVYRYITGRDAGFRDVPQRLVLARQKLEPPKPVNSEAGDDLPEETLERPMLGRYEIERELGKGAMGAVYLARDPKIGRRVAIKTLALSRDFASDDVAEAKARFFREAEAAGNLSHPHIVQIFEAGEDHDLAYIAMEFIKGHDLMVHARPKTLLPVREVLRYLADAADALDYAHGRGIVHRDIKPANLMLITESKILKVTDFGVARFTDPGKGKTGMVIGTPSYMSPEQLAGKKVDGRSDLFSLGVTAYQLLTGVLPFLADSLDALMQKIANDTPAPPSALRADLPAGVDHVIGKALQKDPAARYARGRDLASDLRALLAATT